MVELIWDGKYDKSGQRAAPLRLKLPFQTVETVNESAQQRQMALDLFSAGRPATEWRNRLIWGDKKYVLPALLDEFAGKVDLIYIDPPFNVGADFSYAVELESDDEEGDEDNIIRFTKQPNVVEQKAYRDTWGKGLTSYISWFYEASICLSELLAENGSIYVHLDWHVVHYAKTILDEIFGIENFVNEVIWRRANTHNDPSAFGRIHDTILYYRRPGSKFNKVFGEYREEYIEQAYRHFDQDGRRYRLLPLHSTHVFSSKDDNTRRFGNKILRPPSGKYWRWSQKKITEAMEQNLIVISENDIPSYKKYFDEAEGVLAQSIWDEIKPLTRKDMLGYPTQKPEALLERIIKASSNEGDLVLDCFCLRAGSLVGVVEAPLNPPVNGGTFKALPYEETSPDLRGIVETTPGSRAAAETPPRLRGGRGGLKFLPIEQIRPGHIVISHDGQPHRVLQTHHRDYQGLMVGLRREGNNNTLWLTADHRVLCQKRPIQFTPPSPPQAGGIRGGANPPVSSPLPAGGTEGGQKRGWSHVSPQMFARSQELRQNMTPAEKKLWQALRGDQLGVAFRRQHPLGPYIADFYSRQAGLVIEVDGDSHATAEGRAHDVKRTAWIEEIGLRELRFWNNEIMTNLPGVLERVNAFIGETVVAGCPSYEWRRAADLRVGDIVFHGDTLTPAPILAIEQQDSNETVFDLTVEGSHSYLTDVCLAHNCGSGTTAATAEKLNRRWITCDLGRFAIHTARKRLLSIENVKPFVVQNLGKYERQAWQSAEFTPPIPPVNGGGVVAHYRRFILELYHARPITGYVWLHGLKEGRMVHIGAVDSPVSPSDIKQIAIEFRKAIGAGADAPSQSAVDVLGWDFAFELNEIAKQQAAQANLTMRFIRIPHEVLEKKAVEQGDIRFFELAALAVEAQQKGRAVNLQLTDFVIPPDDVPADVQKAISHWSQWIDYWAVDWDNKGDTFHNMWQTYRTRKDRSLELKAGHKYEKPGDYAIMVKVIDILGNDTTKTLKVNIL